MLRKSVDLDRDRFAVRDYEFDKNHNEYLFERYEQLVHRPPHGNDGDANEELGQGLFGECLYPRGGSERQNEHVSALRLRTCCRDT